MDSRRVAIDHGACGHCGQWSRARAIHFRVGLASRGQSPRTLHVDLRVLSDEAVLLCAACERRLLRAGMLRQIRQHLPILTGPLAIALLGTWLGFRAEAQWLEVVSAAVLIVGSVLWFLLRLRRARDAVLRELVFESRREEYARKLDRPATSLAVYPPAQ